DQKAPSQEEWSGGNDVKTKSARVAHVSMPATPSYAASSPPLPRFRSPLCGDSRTRCGSFETRPRARTVPGQELVHLGTESALQHQPSAVPGELVEDADDLADDLRVVYLVDVIACDHRDVPPLDDLQVNWKGTSLLTYQGLHRGPRFTHPDASSTQAQIG